MHRFYAPGMTADGGRVVLDAIESAHLARVLRLRVGDRVRAFDGRGLEREARVAAARADAADLDLLDRVDPLPDPRVRVTLGMALLKADRFDAVLRDAAMLGVAAVRPLTTERCDVPVTTTSPSRLERWHRIAVASSKQSGRATVTAVHEAAALELALDADRSDVRLLLAEPSIAGAGRPDAGGEPGADPASALLLVGPEGGWAPDEVSAARARGCRVVTIGARTLRADAAPIVALAVLQYLWGDL